MNSDIVLSVLGFIALALLAWAIYKHTPSGQKTVVAIDTDVAGVAAKAVQVSMAELQRAYASKLKAAQGLQEEAAAIAAVHAKAKADVASLPSLE